jgi:hypothetical protein
MDAARKFPGARLLKANKTSARTIWGPLSRFAILRLSDLTLQFSFSVASGDLTLVNGNWYVTHSGLLRLATRKRCAAICALPVPEFCDVDSRRWVFKATIYKSHNSKAFTGYGDADPSNVSLLVHGAEMRMAETRSVNRALRKAYGIGICSVEEIGSFAGPGGAQSATRKLPLQPVNGNGNNGHGGKVRDRLCQLIRQHQLDANLVKSYATDFCGTKTLRDATREQVENFVAHLADWAAKDRNALLCQLNSYARPERGAA